MGRSSVEVEERLKEIEEEFNKATFWGAYLSVLYEEKQNLLRDLVFLRKKHDE